MRTAVYLERAIDAEGDHCGSDCEYARESGSCALFLEMRKEVVLTDVRVRAQRGDEYIVSVKDGPPMMLTKEALDKVSKSSVWMRLDDCIEAQQLTAKPCASDEPITFGPGI